MNFLELWIMPDISNLSVEELRKLQVEAEALIASKKDQAIEDAYKRLIKPSIEREIRANLKEVAENQAIHIFSENVRQLLLQPPMKGKVVLGVDPAFRTGCKLAVVDETGKVLDIDVIYHMKNLKVQRLIQS